MSTTALPFWHEAPRKRSGPHRPAEDMQTNGDPRWYSDVDHLLGEVPPLTADELFHIALRQTYSLGHWLDRDDEARTDQLLAESVQLDLAQLEAWEESRERDYDVTSEVE